MNGYKLLVFSALFLYVGARVIRIGETVNRAGNFVRNHQKGITAGAATGGGAVSLVLLAKEIYDSIKNEAKRDNLQPFFPVRLSTGKREFIFSLDEWNAERVFQKIADGVNKQKIEKICFIDLAGGHKEIHKTDEEMATLLLYTSKLNNQLDIYLC